jgi:Predicted sugar phosphatases of the HAD superfamily
MSDCKKFKNKKAVLLDLDGTVYAGEAAIPGASEFVRDCAARGIRCVFVTNRANRTPEEVRDQLVSMGIDCRASDIITTATATALYVGSGSAYVIGEHGLTSALEAQGIKITDKNPDCVIASLDRFFTYDKLATAASLLEKGAKFIATNLDARLKLKDSIMPGSGSIAAAVSTASGKTPVVIGKPERHLVEVALKLCGATKDEALIVGDNIDTDIGAGANAGIETVLLLTGVSTRADAEKSRFKPDAIAEDYAQLSALVF